MYQAAAMPPTRSRRSSSLPKPLELREEAGGGLVPPVAPPGRSSGSGDQPSEGDGASPYPTFEESFRVHSPYIEGSELAYFEEYPRFAGIDSRQLLNSVYTLVREKGYRLGNADLTILAQRPKMAPHIQSMRESIAGVLDVDIDRISVKATTTESLGFVGRREGIAAHAVCLLEQGSR